MSTQFPLFPPPLTPIRPVAGSTLRSAQSPVRHQRIFTKDDILLDLSPTTTLEAFRSPSGRLKKSVEAATPGERAFGVRATLAAKHIEEWLEEIEDWRWSTKSGFAEVPKQQLLEESMGSDKHVEDDQQRHGEVKYMGSLTVAQVQQHQARIAQIREDMDALDVEGIKNQVLDNHIPSRSRPATPISPYPTSPVNFSASTPATGVAPRFLIASNAYTRMDDFTAVVTATVLQALPKLSKLMRLLNLWTTRISVLLRIPGILAGLTDAEVALTSAWRAIALTSASTKDSSSSLSSDNTTPSLLTRDAVDIMRSVLQDKVTHLGRELDFCLDALEGREDTLPEILLDRMEDIEQGYGDWVVCADARVREGELMTARREELDRLKALQDAADAQAKAESERLRLEREFEAREAGEKKRREAEAARVEADKTEREFAEAEKAAGEKADAEANEKIRIEEEARAKADKAAKDLAEAEAEAKLKEAEANEKARFDAETKTKADAEAKAEADKLAKEMADTEAKLNEAKAKEKADTEAKTALAAATAAAATAAGAAAVTAHSARDDPAHTKAEPRLEKEQATSPPRNEEPLLRSSEAVENSQETPDQHLTKEILEPDIPSLPSIEAPVAVTVQELTIASPKLAAEAAKEQDVPETAIDTASPVLSEEVGDTAPIQASSPEATETTDAPQISEIIYEGISEQVENLAEPPALEPTEGKSPELMVQVEVLSTIREETIIPVSDPEFSRSEPELWSPEVGSSHNLDVRSGEDGRLNLPTIGEDEILSMLGSEATASDLEMERLELEDSERLIPELQSTLPTIGEEPILELEAASEDLARESGRGEQDFSQITSDEFSRASAIDVTILTGDDDPTLALGMEETLDGMVETSDGEARDMSSSLPHLDSAGDEIPISRTFILPIRELSKYKTPPAHPVESVLEASYEPQPPSSFELQGDDHGSANEVRRSIPTTEEEHTAISNASNSDEWVASGQQETTHEADDQKSTTVKKEDQEEMTVPPPQLATERQLLPSPPSLLRSEASQEHLAAKREPSSRLHSRSGSLITDYSAATPEILEAEPAEYFRPSISPTLVEHSRPEELQDREPSSLEAAGSSDENISSESAEPRFAGEVWEEIPPEQDELDDQASDLLYPSVEQSDDEEPMSPLSARRLSLTRITTPTQHINVSRDSPASDTTVVTRRVGSYDSRMGLPSREISFTSASDDDKGHFPNDTEQSPSVRRVGLSKNRSTTPDSPPPVRRKFSLRKSSSLKKSSNPSAPSDPSSSIAALETPVLKNVDVLEAPVLSPTKHRNTDEQMQQQISSILDNIPAKIRLTSDPESEDKSDTGLQVKKTRQRTVTPLRSNSSLSSHYRAPTPSFTLAPAYPKGGSRIRPPTNNPEIKLYHLSRSTGETPIKLFVRLVGESGERVMVRVGGGWADLGEYLKEYASHHGRRNETVEIQDGSTHSHSRVVSSESTNGSNNFRSSLGAGGSGRHSSFGGYRGASSSNGRESPFLRSVSAMDGPAPAPTNIGKAKSSFNLRKPRKSAGADDAITHERQSSISSTGTIVGTGVPTTPGRSSHTTTYETPGSHAALSVADTSRSSSRASFHDDSPSSFHPSLNFSSSLNSNSSYGYSRESSPALPLGLAGPKSKKMHISDQDQEWVDTMQQKVRQASAEKEEKRMKMNAAGTGLGAAGRKKLRDRERERSASLKEPEGIDEGEHQTPVHDDANGRSVEDKKDKEVTELEKQKKFGDMGKVGGTKRLFRRG